MRTETPKTLNELVAKTLATELMDQYNLSDKGWKFYFNDNRSRLGVCKEYDKSIELSIWHCNNSPFAEVKNILLHEIAHAIVGCRHQHNSVWRNKAIQIGCTGDRCGVMNAPHKFTGTCPNCGKTFKKNKRGNIACGNCCKRMNGGKYSKDFQLIWNRN